MKRLDKTYQKTLEKMYELAKKISKEFEWDDYKKIWDICGKWNDKYPECEIFVCEYSLDEEGNDTGKVTGICIEDDVFRFSDEV